MLSRPPTHSSSLRRSTPYGRDWCLTAEWQRGLPATFLTPRSSRDLPIRSPGFITIIRSRWKGVRIGRESSCRAAPYIVYKNDFLDSAILTPAMHQPTEDVCSDHAWSSVSFCYLLLLSSFERNNF